nr:retrovirus-related Pol polyprotein from transposon TNT 1-94 [Tanacetum cinerariifolium]
MLESVENSPLIWLTVEENGVTRTKKYVELSAAEKIQVDCDLKATNIIFQGLAVPVFSSGDDPIAYLNNAMAFLTVVDSLRFLSTNNQLRTSSNLRNQATIQDGRVTVQQVLRRQGQSYFGTDYKSNATSYGGNNASGQTWVVKCYNCQAVLMANISNYGYDVISKELLVYVRDTCPNAIKPSAKKVAVTPNNNVKKVRITSANIVPPKKTTSYSVETKKLEHKVYSRKPKTVKNIGLSKKDKIVESKNANHSKPNHSWGSNASDISSSSSLIITVRFGNDHIARFTGYGDYQLGNITISRVYYVEGLGHNLFSVGQFCDADLEVAFRKNTCLIRNLEGVDLIFGYCDTNLYTISLDDMLKTSSICLLSKASKTKSWKMNILVTDDDYSRFIWVRFLRSKDEAPKVIIKCIKNIQVRLNATVRNVRTDNGTEFVNQTLREFYENVGISHQTSVARTPQQNNVVERRNQTLVEAARTMLISSKALLFLCAEAINTACYTQNRSLISLHYNKTSYELMQDKKLDLSFFHIFGALCYPTNDIDDLDVLASSQGKCLGLFITACELNDVQQVYSDIDQANSFVRASSSAGVKHLIPSRLTRYLNLSTGKT